MMPAAISGRARELAAEGTSFVTATVVRAQRPTSVEAGDVALVLADGSIEGFVGGSCAEHSVRACALEALSSGDPVLLRILPFAGAQEEVAAEEGAVTVQNPCLSGGAIEVFLEPTLPAPRVVVVGDTPIATALVRIGAELGLDLVAGAEPRAGDLALVVAAHGQDELPALRRGLEAGLPYVGLVASRERGDGVIGELRGEGLAKAHTDRIDVPAGLAIGARAPAEIALSILARIVAVRRAERPAGAAPEPEAAATLPRSGSGASPPATTAVDPICGMTVLAVASTPSVPHGDATAYFCGEGCKAAFQAQLAHAAD